MAPSQTPPQILVTIMLSSETLSKSSEEPFTLTIHASVEGKHTITADAFRTLLHPRMDALGYQGLTFRDIETGDFAPRVVIDFHIRPAEMRTITSPSIIEIPSASSSETGYTVSHTFDRERMLTGLSQSDLDTISEMIGQNDEELSPDLVEAVEKRYANTDVEGFKAGRTYEIGLGTEMDVISWWKVGSKVEVFANGPMPRTPLPPGVPGLKMKLVNTVRLKVVE